MPNQEEKFWSDIVGQLRRALRLRELSQEEAKREYKAAEEIALSDERIDAIVGAAVSGEHAVWTTEPQVESWPADMDTASIEDQVRQLNRNLGEADDQVDELIDKHRREVFEDDDGVERTNGVDRGEESNESGG
jgi:hypothetical protein